MKWYYVWWSWLVRFSVCNMVIFYRASARLAYLLTFLSVRLWYVCHSVRHIAPMSKRMHNTVNFSTHVTAIILVFEPNRRYKIPTRDLAHSEWNICVSQPQSPFISEQVRDKPIITYVQGRRQARVGKIRREAPKNFFVCPPWFSVCPPWHT